LTINQHVTQGEILRHTNDGVVNGGVTVRMVLTDHVTDDTGRLLVRPVPVVIELMHREQNTTVNGL
jgi:hypothetical protein